ncbi:nuclear transport factor 2 family protein [Reyranella aquatilis]|uniref:Nuclear transport factor 2 family protein n=1 Tax=Reyranella aquatilis TaxID=2035356 RepID=A0ABS8KMW6_9HYPH|nr:SgcJ/EcaC family oxidoreductase [Reyranella aquatilis]MCC8427385.1 nuclear transport factor 2 family protein [Reyranella aquatilis]
MRPITGLLCLPLLLTSLPAFAGPAEDADALVDRWAATYSANDSEALVKLYTPDAILLGTTSPVMSEGTEQIRTYFKDLAGSGRKNAIVERRTIVLDEKAVVTTGFYNFARASEGDVPRPSRFTMLIVKRDGQWMIRHHHSSPKAATRQ